MSTSGIRSPTQLLLLLPLLLLGLMGASLLPFWQSLLLLLLLGVESSQLLMSL
jgi:hypothetical protein